MENKEMKNSFFSNFKLYKDVYKAGSMIKLSNEKHLKLVLKEIGWRIVTLSLLSTKETSRFRMLHNFGMHIIKMNKHHGEVYTVKYLKACQLSIQKKIAGQPFKSLREVEPDYNFPRLSKSGLPSVIKVTDRSSICNDSFRIIRLWLSIFSIYRIIKIPFSPKLNTITDNFVGSQIHLDDFNHWLNNNSNLWLTKFSNMNIGALKSYRILPILKSSPQGSKSFSHLVGSYIGLRDSSLWPYIQEFTRLTDSKNINTLFRNIEFCISKYNITSKVSNNHLGKLSFKEESAGKLRVFAMVDVITQSLFYPLHISLFSLFKKLPNDCTHDQNKGFRYAQELSLKYNCSYGFDLSAATDRLPLSSQVSVLNSIFGSNIGTLWGKILVERDFIISDNQYGIEPGKVRYSVGQPMGALSSWAMLNLVHHMMVQFIAFHLGKVSKGVWYKEYIILGDDLVLFEKDVADRYLSLCKQLGVSINLSKSIISESKPVLEFAKRTSLNGKDVSALPAKELLSTNNFFGRLALTTRLIENSWGSDMFRVLTIGNMKKNSSRIDLIYPLVGYLTQLYQKGIIPLSYVLSLITNKDKPLSFFGRNINWMSPKIISRVVKNYMRDKVIKKDSLPVRERFYAAYNSIIFKNILIHRINSLTTKIKNIDVQMNRINLLDHIITSPELENWYKSQTSSLELVKPLTNRWYWNDPTFKKFKNMFMEIAPLADVFFVSNNQSIPSIRLLRQGLDIDLIRGKGFSFTTLKYDLLYLNEFNGPKETLKDYYNSQRFVDLTLEKLLSNLSEVQNCVRNLLFYEPDLAENKEKLDNPLKVLDFIKDIHNPKFKVKSDFVKFDGNYIEAEAPVDVSPGFKPKFDFGSKAKKFNISIF